MFTLDWSWENKGVPDLNFSETPEHKCAHLFKMENGNYYAIQIIESFGLMTAGHSINR